MAFMEGCTPFLRWALPRLGLRFEGFRRVRHQVCKRLKKRLKALGLDLEGYRSHLLAHPEEWEILDGLCHISISRFYRDPEVFKALEGEVLPRLAARCLKRKEKALEVWSAGCASGEEPYTLAILWQETLAPRFPLDIHILATDADPTLIARAQRACYPQSSLKALPWKDAFLQKDGAYCLKARYRRPVTFLLQDMRRAMPQGPFPLILCRNSAFTYFALEVQREVLEGIRARLVTGGVLVIGRREALPEARGWRPCGNAPGIFEKVA